MAGETFDKLKSGLNKSITTLNMKTSSALEKTKIKTHIGTLTTEIERAKTALGEKVFLAWSEGSFQTESIEGDLHSIKDMLDEIDRLHLEYKKVDEKERDVLGGSAAEAGGSGSVESVCPGCGSGYKALVKFCPKCGTKLPS